MSLVMSSDEEEDATYRTKVCFPPNVMDSTTTSVSRTVESSGILWTVELTPKENSNKHVAKIWFTFEKEADQGKFNVFASGSIKLRYPDDDRALEEVLFCFTESRVLIKELKTYSSSRYIEVVINYNRKVSKSGTTTKSSQGKWTVLLESGYGTDAVFVVDGVDIPVHTLILSASSPVFKAMFTHETRDKLEKRVVIKDATAEAFKEMLRCAYADCDPEYKSDAFLLEVLALADRYDIADLKSRCARKLVDTMTEENMIGRVALVLEDASCLCEATIIYLLKRMGLSPTSKEKILQTRPDWSQFLA